MDKILEQVTRMIKMCPDCINWQQDQLTSKSQRRLEGDKLEFYVVVLKHDPASSL